MNLPRPTTSRARALVRWVLALLVAAAILGGLMRESVGAISYDTPVGTSSTSASSLTWSHTVPSTNDRLVLVGVQTYGTSVTVSGVTFGGTAMTLLTTETGGNPTSGVRATVYYLLAPPAGTATVTVTLSGTTKVIGSSHVFTGVSQMTPIAGSTTGSNNSATTMSLTMTAASGDLVADTIAVRGDVTLSAGSGQTAATSSTGTLSSDIERGLSAKAGATSTTVSWSTGGINTPYAHIAVRIRPSYTLSGTVFEDVNYGGGAGRSLSGSGGSGRSGATVELYSSSGAYVRSTTTGTGGTYSFTGLDGGTTYYVRQVTSTVSSSRSGYTSSLLPVLTYRTNASGGSAAAVTDHVGGINPSATDPGAASSGATFNTSTFVYSAGLSGTAQAVTQATVGSASISGIDFGVNFDTVVNTGNSGAGSLRQVLTNANTLGGDSALAVSGRTAGQEHVVFMIGNGSSAAGLRSSINLFSGGIATITPTSSLPALTSALVVDATTQPGWSSAPVVKLDGVSAGGSGDGFYITGSGSTVRGFSIVRFQRTGVYLNGAGATGNTVAGNYLGLNPDGTANGNYEGVNLQDSASGNTIGGSATADRNVISSSTSDGVQLGLSASSNTIRGNYVGLDPTGTLARGNGADGIDVDTGSASNQIIGNVVSNSGGDGLEIGDSAPDSPNNVVQGNLIGTRADGSGSMPNAGWGIRVGGSSPATGLVIGGILSGQGNTVANNTSGGIRVASGLGVSILGNSLFNNGGLGIDIAATGETTNDGAQDTSLGNAGMDRPVFSRTTYAGSVLTLVGYVGSAAGQSSFANARVEFFIADANSAGPGEGRTYLGTLTTDANGNFSGTLSVTSGITAGTTYITATATDTSNNTSEFSSNSLVTAGYDLSGTVFEDLNYGGGAGRSLASSAGIGVGGARVELYDSSGAFVGATTSAADGSYSFTSWPAGTYRVRLVTGSTPSSRVGWTASAIPVLTYRTNASTGSAVAVTDQVGGVDPAVADAGSGDSGTTVNTTSGLFTAGISGTAQALAPAVITSTNITGVDFGVNFSTVVNTNNSGQGSLRQFITNVNLLEGQSALAQSGSRVDVDQVTQSLPAGRETSIFMIPAGTAVAGHRSSVASQLTGGVAVITLSSTLPTITRTLVVLDGGTQTANVGNSNSGVYGAGGTVGADALTLKQIPRPEVQLSLASPAGGLTLGADTLVVRGFALVAAGSQQPSAITVSNATSGALIEGNLIGSAAATLADPGSSSQLGTGIYINGGDNGTARHNLVAWTVATGIQLLNAANGWTVEYNEVRDGGLYYNNADGIALTSATSTTIRGNLISGHSTQGIVSTTAGDNAATIVNNTLSGNGVGPATAATTQSHAFVARSGVSGIRLESNLISANYGAGVAVNNGATGIVLSRNHVYGNGTITSRNGSAASGHIDVDLNTAADNSNFGSAPFVTANDSGDTDSGGNNLQNFPVLTGATLAGSTLTVTGTLDSTGSSHYRIEFFATTGANASGHGGATSYLGSATVASGTGVASFTFTLSSGAPAAGTKITATATRTDAAYTGDIETSEFAANITVVYAITGSVFEDLNYGGGAGRSMASASGAAVSGARVELYDAAGAFVSATTTDAAGAYSLGAPSSAAYFVRVVSGTVLSTRSGATSAQLGVLTYRTNASSGSALPVVDHVGGSNPALADSGNGDSGTTLDTSSYSFTAGLSGTAHAVAPVTPGTAGVSGVDFGFHFTSVVNTNPSGQGSLAQAVANANVLGADASLATDGRTPGIEHIVFMIGNGSSAAGLRSSINLFSGGVASIAPGAELGISQPLVLDAQTQPGWSTNPIVELSGTGAPAGHDGVAISAGGSTVRGLILNHWPDKGVAISAGDGITLQGNWIGLAASGTAAAANADGVYLGGGDNHQLGGSSAATRNVISGNSGHGVWIAAGGGHRIEGNYIGLNAAGNAAAANGSRGVFIDSAVTGATLGGSASGTGNVISGNAGYAVWLAGGATTVQGNLIGLNAAGTAAIGNTHGLYLPSGGHQIGGSSAATRNVISGNTNRGIWLDSSGNTVQGNHLGTNAAGTAAIPNNDGLYVNGANNSIGGSAAGAGNLISGNTRHGVQLDAAASGTVLQSNVIGLAADGSSTLANATGIDVGCSSGCTIGGSGFGNTIAGNSGHGVQVAATSSGNAILGNAIHGNGSLGIDLGADGVTDNDGLMPAGTANVQMDAPVFSSARVRGAALTVAGHVGNAAGQVAFAGSRVEVFVSDGDTSGRGEGRVYLGALTADASGNFSGTLTMPVSTLAIGTRLSGTATSTANNTSEFGPQFTSLVVDFVVNTTADDVDNTIGDGQCLTAAGLCSLRAAIAELNAWGTLPTTPTLTFALPACTAAGQAACSIEVGSALPALNRAMDIDGRTQTGWASAAPVVEVNGAATAAGIAGFTVSGGNGSTLQGLVINRFGGAGIVLAAGTSGHTVSGNFIGTDASGSAAAGNGGHGIELRAGSSTVSGNLVSGNTQAGIYVSASDTSINGNLIGTDASGSSAIANQYGIRASGSAGLSIGGGSAALSNTVSGNSAAGIHFDSGNTGVTIQGNRIGRNAADSGALGNGGSGISVTNIGCCTGLSGSSIGGTTSGAGNVIAHNGSAGITMSDGSGAQAAIQGNAIYANGGLGIDLGNDGLVNSNTGAKDAGKPNAAMNHPVFTGAGVADNGLALTVYGYIGTGSGQAAFAGARVEIFKAAADPSGYGEGQIYLGYLTADGNGQFSGTISISSGQLSAGDPVTATATDGSGNSSEFGPDWTSTTVAGLTPAGFNAFETSTPAGSLSGVLNTRIAGSASTLDVIAFNAAGSGLHPGFTGTVSLSWVDARDDSGAVDGSCRASWASLGSAGSAVFASASRLTVSVTPPATSTRVMRLKMSYTAMGGAVTTACSNDAFAAIPASLTLTASDADAASAGTTRTLDNTGATDGVVHRAGRAFTVRGIARDATGATMSAYDGSPALTLTGCVLPTVASGGCASGTLTAPGTAAIAGTYTNNAVSYSEVGAITLKLTDTSYADIDAGDTAAASRTIASADTAVGRFVPDAYALQVSSNGTLATANAACLAAGSGATFFGQGTGWAATPQVTVTALNAAGATTTLWAGSLAKLSATSAVPTMATGSAGSATLAASYGTLSYTALGSGQARYTAASSDRFVLELPGGSPQASTTPDWSWTLALTDASEAAVVGNPTLSASSTQTPVPFDQGAVFHSGRLALAPAHGDARAGVRQLVELQRWTSAGWVTMTEDRGCVTVQPQNLAVGSPEGIFGTSGVCAAPLGAAATTRGGRARLVLPATPGAAHGRLITRLVADGSGTACTPAGVTQTAVSLNLPWLLSGAGPSALATWGRANREVAFRRETW